MPGDEDTGGTTTIEAPAAESASTADTAPAVDSAAEPSTDTAPIWDKSPAETDDSTTATEPAADAGDEFSKMTGLVRGVLDAKAPAPTDTAPVTEAAAKPAEAGPAPTLPADLVKDITENGLSFENTPKLIEALNKSLAEMHTQIGAVKPVADQVKTVADRQAAEDAQREDAAIDAVFDSFADMGRDIYGKGDKANPHARRATYIETMRIAKEIGSDPVRRAAFQKAMAESKTDPRRALMAMAHENIHGAEITEPQAIKKIQGTVQKRSAQRTIPPSGNSARADTGDMYADMKAIWRG